MTDKHIKSSTICLFVLLFVAMFFFGCANSSCDVRSINHRGYSSVAPENTLSAYRLSAEMGFDYVEADVSFTCDGHAVLLHDGSVDRTSNGEGKISELTFEYVRSLDFGSWKSAEYAGEQIPTFEEFIDLCDELNLHAYVEIKTGGVTQEQVLSLLEVVNSRCMQNSVTWISFDFEILKIIAGADDDARIGILVNSISDETVQKVQLLENGKNDVFLDCNYEGLDESAVALCKKNRIPLEVWTVNSVEEMEKLDSYVSGVTSDSLVAENFI